MFRKSTNCRCRLCPKAVPTLRRFLVTTLITPLILITSRWYSLSRACRPYLLPIRQARSLIWSSDHRRHCSITKLNQRRWSLHQRAGEGSGANLLTRFRLGRHTNSSEPSGFPTMMKGTGFVTRAACGCGAMLFLSCVIKMHAQNILQNSGFEEGSFDKLDDLSQQLYPSRQSCL